MDQPIISIKYKENGNYQIIDIRGTIVLISSFLIVLTYLEDIESEDSDIVIVFIFSIICIASFIFFILFESRTKFPIIPLSIFKDKN